MKYLSIIMLTFILASCWTSNKTEEITATWKTTTEINNAVSDLDIDDIEEEILEEGLSKKVSLVGKIEDAGQYLKAFDIFILPSIKEGFPFVLLEAGLAKLPVIASDVGGIPELISDGENGILVEAKEDDDIEDALKVLISDVGLREKYGEALYGKVKGEFSFEKMINKTEKLY